MTFYRVFNDHILLNIRLSPGAKKIGFNGVFEADDGVYLKVSVTAVPEDNKANKALIVLLSKHFKIPKSAIEIIQGQTHRNKILRLNGGGLDRRCYSNAGKNHKYNLINMMSFVGYV